jgi:hypothetical protein
MAEADNAASPEDSMNNPAVNFAWVLRDEDEEIRHLCANRGAAPDLTVPESGSTSPESSSKPPATGGKDTRVCPQRLGIALSGGGIRSASVNLGLIQSLAKAGILKQVHYMSGISGGGYILGWLASWIRRSGFEMVQEELESGRASDINSKAHASSDYNRFLEPHPIRHLREFASYLTPRMGLASGDTLALISIYLRNVLLNQTLIVSAAAGILALLQMLAPWIAWRAPRATPWQAVLLLVGFSAAVVSGLRTGKALNCLGTNQKPKYEPKKAGYISAFSALVMAICLWLILPTTFTSCFWGSRGCNNSAIPGAILAGLFMLVMYLCGFLADTLGKRELLGAVDDSITKTIFAALTAMIAAAAFLFAVVFGFEKWLTQSGQVYVGDWYVMLGLPAIMVALALGSYVHIGIFGDLFPDAKREWLGRLAGYYLFFAAVIAVFMIAALRGPLWMHLLFKGISASTSSGAWLKWILPGGWIFAVLSGLIAGASSQTGDRGPDQSRVLNILAKAAPPVFLIGVLLLVSWAVYTLAGKAGAPKYLTWVEDDHEGRPIAKLVKPSGDDSTTYVYAGSLKDASNNLKSIFELRGCRWATQPSGEACPSRTPTPSPNLTPILTPSANPIPTPSATRTPGPTMCLPGSDSPLCQSKTLDISKQSNERQAPECAPKKWSLLKPLLKVAIIALLIAGILLGRLDVNEFSMHLFYRNRLVRAFLGASNVKGKQASGMTSKENLYAGRRPSPFTGFALDDDVPLQELCSWWKRDRSCYEEQEFDPAASESWQGYDGPYPIWGTALNLTAGKYLAWQKRQAASFIYSPLYCGWDYVSRTPAAWEPPATDTKCNETDELDKRPNRCKYGYRGTGRFRSTNCERTPYTGQGCGPSVGNALAASGAAISPNWGYHTTKSVAALLAIFNVRIGWWTGNPRRKDSWDRYAPGAYYLTAELLGSTDDSGKYVYLSDGGHFENLGIYELVRRRMKYIIACDAGGDPDYKFDDLANAVEKCRRDFGVEIEIDTSSIKPGRKSQLSKSHFAVGQIKYPTLDATSPECMGVLVFLKSSLTGDESADVLGQRSEDSKFPHDTTVNQFFNETQFEVYRALGEHMFDTLWEYYAREQEKDQGPDYMKKRLENLKLSLDHPERALYDFFHKLDGDRKKKRDQVTEKQRQALRPENSEPPKPGSERN